MKLSIAIASMMLVSLRIYAVEITPVYNPDWPFKVTQHTTENHQVCDISNPAACGCDHMITPDTHAGRIKIRETKTNPSAGEKVCIVGGSHSEWTYNP